MIFQLSMFIQNCLPKAEPLLCSQPQSVLSLSCGSRSDIARDRLTASRGSICDYSLQRHFQKSASLLDPPGALALFCFISFGVFNVTQRGIMERATWKPPHHQQDGHAMFCCSLGVLTLSACQWLKRCIFNSSELKERSQHVFLFFFWFQSAASLSSSHTL